MRFKWTMLLLCMAAPGLFAADTEETLLLRLPTVSENHIAFVYAGDIWIAGRDGQNVRRLTVHEGYEDLPHFSPDGKHIAFNANYDGNMDVYVVSVNGGDPKRLTYHGSADQVRGWHPDGKHILFRSNRASSMPRYGRLLTVSVEGGLPQPLPMPQAERGSFSADADKIAYTPISDPFYTWKRYRGGQMPMIWVFDLESYNYEEIPKGGANNSSPVWIGEKVYFISDRNHTMNVYVYDTNTKQVNQVTRHDDFDVKSLTGGAGMLTYDQGGRIYLLDPNTGQSNPVPIHIDADLPAKRPRFEKVGRNIRSGTISPTGVRAAFEVRGEIVTLPAKKGGMRNITQSPGTNERSPSWSPNGGKIAYFSDARGEYDLVIRDQKGLEAPRVIDLPPNNFYHDPTWSPDGKRILLHDKKLNLWYLDVEKGEPVLVDTDTYDHPDRTLSPDWSPDSRWITYAKRQTNHMRAIHIYDTQSGESRRITTDGGDAISPRFSRDGKYLFYAGSTDLGLNAGWLDMSSYDRPVTRGIYMAVLQASEPSPFLPESDEEDVKEEKEESEEKDSSKKDEKEKKDGKESEKSEKDKDAVVIDFDGLDQRILALPIPERNYFSLDTADGGKLFYLEAVPNQPGLSMHRFDMKERKSEAFMGPVFGYEISHDGKKLIYAAPGNRYGIVGTGGKAKVGDGSLATSQLELWIEPEAEWRQMFNEIYRIQRDYFYVENLHGLDWEATREKYLPFVDHVGHRTDLNRLFADFIGELVIGHNYVGGGDTPSQDNVSVGLLGAEYTIESNRYRIAKIYSGLNWNPNLRAPLTAPGIQVKEGEYILAVNGRQLLGSMNIFTHFQNTAGKQVVLTINDSPVMDGAREVTVVPVSSEVNLKRRNWIENNRKRVQEATNNRAAYIYMPNTAGAGYEGFNRGYFNAIGSDAVILDERMNGGGSAADYVIDMLDRQLFNYWKTREGELFTTPNAAIFGPKVMIIDQYAGSGGDAMPYYFRAAGLGKLIGTTTWGGLVGIYDYPGLMDGGFITAPRLGIVSTDGKYVVENVGVPPDIEVIYDPKAVIEGRDPQLEKAIEVILEELKTYKLPSVTLEPEPNRVK